MTRLVASFVVLLALITSQGWAWRGSRGLRQTGAYWRTSLQSLPSNNDNMLSPSSKLLEGARRLREEAQRLETERDGIPVDVVKLNDFAKPNSPREHNESSLGSFVYRNNNSTYKIPTSKTDETSTKQTWTLNSQGYVVFSAEDLQTFLVPRGQESSQKEELLRKITRDFPSTPTKTPETVAKVSAPIVEAPNIAVVIPSRREAALPGMKSVNVKDLPLRVLLQHVPPEAIPDADSMVESLTMAYIYRKSVSFLIWCNIEAMSIDFEELSDVPIFKQIAKYFSTITVSDSHHHTFHPPIIASSHLCLFVFIMVFSLLR